MITPVSPEMQFKGFSTYGDHFVAVSSDDKLYEINNQGSVGNTPIQKPFTELWQYENADLVPGHSARGAVTFNPRYDLYANLYLSVDSEGKAWIQMPDTAPTIIQGTDAIDFHQVVADQYDALYLGSPRKYSSSTTIAQMPTAGAPEGNTLIGVIALGLGLAAGVLALRRRSMNC